MVEHVRRRALLCKEFSDVVVATCDREIAAVIERAGGRVIMTSKGHEAASDRVAEAMGHLDCTHVMNVQGDEILVLPSDLSAMALAIAGNAAESAWNAIAKINDAQELGDSSIVKCVVSRSSRILYCSRDFSRFSGGNGGFEPVRKILGIVAYSASFLERYAKLERTPLELAEGVDQSRIIEHDVTLRGVEFSEGYPGINEPREVGVVEKFLVDDPKQRDTLARILDA